MVDKALRLEGGPESVILICVVNLFVDLYSIGYWTNLYEMRF